MLIRDVRAQDFGVLREIEVKAGTIFADHGMPEVAEYEPPSIERLIRYRNKGVIWVSADTFDVPVGYLMAEPVDGCLHVEQVSVLPERARQGVGAALIERAAQWAREKAMPALTLTTFVEVPWNGPYYQRLGFRQLADADVTDGLRKIREHEESLGLDRWQRCCMRRDLG